MLRRLIPPALSVPAERLPARVRRTIARQEEDSEKLIGWVQLAIVLVFTVLYTVAPKTFDERAALFEPVPLALGGYALFTLIRLALAYRKRLPDWFLYLSMVIDMVLLMGLIWSFHIQYHQPASFYLKAPTLLYVFIFIALRALRFEPRFVLTAGLVAAAGWGGMMTYAMTIDPLDRMLTRNYVEYLTSNKILIGAEIDKMLTIVLVTGILALALGRARHLLVTAVAEGAKARDLARFFAPEVADRITAAEQRILPGQGEARDAAILMVDLRGFTRLAADMAPGEVIGLLAEYQSRIVPRDPPAWRRDRQVHGRRHHGDFRGADAERHFRRRCGARRGGIAGGGRQVERGAAGEGSDAAGGERGAGLRTGGGGGGRRCGPAGIYRDRRCG